MDKKKLKIVFLSRYQNTVNRGVETFVKEITGYLSKKHQVDVFSGKDSDNLSKILSGKYDIVIPTNGRLQSLKVSLGRLIGGYKVLISGHSGIGRDDIWNIVVVKPEVFVVLTDCMASWAKRWAWGSKVVKIPNGVDIKKFNPIGEKITFDLPRPVIISVGALTNFKRHKLAIEAVSLLDKGSLLIVGQGEDKEKLELLGKEKLKNNFKIVSSAYEDMPKIYRGADIFTLPSWKRESFGIVYLEALASGLPVVATDDLSRKEIIGDGGILVDVENIKEYAQCIKYALNKKWDDLPRKQAEKFSWDKVAQEYQILFEGMKK